MTPPDRPGNGESRHWTRRINGRLYSFVAVTMPGGERRYGASRYDGPEHMIATGTFACDWTRMFFITIPAD